MSASVSAVTPTASVVATAWEQFRALLEAQRAECLRERELALAETATSHPDLVAVARSATLLARIAEIDAAVERIAAGTYGTCEHCGAAIPVERLEFRPYAISCVACSPR